MSADAYVSSSRLRAPNNLSSTTLFGRRSTQHRFPAASTTYRGWRADEREGDPALIVPPLDSDAYDPPLESSGDSQDLPEWLDLDRFEDWEKPTLASLCPSIRIPFEDDLFPVAVAEDGESLPAEIHPSHPYGNLHATTSSYVSRRKIPPRRGLNYQTLDEAAAATGSKSQQTDEEVKLPAILAVRARQGIAPNAPDWPFKRHGPGPGGPNTLARAENRRPWRPYKAVWADLGLEELLPKGPPVTDMLRRPEYDDEKAYLPQEGEISISNVEAVLQEMEEYEAHLPHQGDDGDEPERGKKKRRVQNTWQWGQRVEPRQG